MSEVQKKLSTTARISLGSAGPAIPMREQLRFQLDHALARDAVHAELDVAVVLRELEARGWEGVVLRSAAMAAKGERREYLRRPDLGRRLDAESALTLAEKRGEPVDVVFVVADGLSALAVERHALPLLDALIPGLVGRSIGPVCVVTQGRVAIGDEIGELLGAKLVVMLIGERPGLSSPDSLGAYVTWQPRVGRTYAERNCISNIRAEGLSYADAAARIAYYVREAFRVEATGIALKDPVSGVLAEAGGKLVEAPEAPGVGAQARSATGTLMY
jgi:ethanolamine ammonia-lyase small subunit